MIVVYMTCDDVAQAKRIAEQLMKRRLCACVNIIPEMQPMFFWPPKSDTIDESKEVILLAKTIEAKYQALEDLVHEIHEHDTPCVFALPVTHVAKKYYDWLVGEIE